MDLYCFQMNWKWCSVTNNTDILSHLKVKVLIGIISIISTTLACFGQLSPIFILFWLCFWSQPTPEGSKRLLSCLMLCYLNQLFAFFVCLTVVWCWGGSVQWLLRAISYLSMSTQFAFIYLYVYTFSCHFDNHHNNIMTIICH